MNRTWLTAASTRVLIVGAVLILCVRLFLVFKRAFFTPLQALPGPWYARWTGSWLTWKVITGQRAQYIHEMHHKYGHYVRIAPNEVSTSDVSSHLTIYGGSSKFYKSEWYLRFTKVEDPDEMPGMFATTNPRLHGERRKLFSHLWSNTSIMGKESTVRAKIDMAVDKFARDARKDGHADILKWWYFLAADVMAALSFGSSFELLEQEKKNRYMIDLQKGMMLYAIRAEFMGLFSWLEHLPFKFIQDALKVRARVDGYGEQAIQKHKAVLAKDPSASTSLFARFLDPTRHKSELTDRQLANEAGNLILAGSDTTANSLAYLTYALLRPCNKHALQKVKEEIATLSIDAPARDILALPYLRKTIDESLRLYSGTTSLPRDVPPTGANLGGYFIPAGTTVSTQSYTLMRDPEIFHDPESFIPERWDNPTQSMKDAWSPFSMGSRGCLGIHLAMLQLTCAIFTLLKKCPSVEIARTTTDEDMEPQCFFILSPKRHKLDLALKG